MQKTKIAALAAAGIMLISASCFAASAGENWVGDESTSSASVPVGGEMFAQAGSEVTNYEWKTDRGTMWFGRSATDWKTVGQGETFAKESETTATYRSNKSAANLSERESETNGKKCLTCAVNYETDKTCLSGVMTGANATDAKKCTYTLHVASKDKTYDIFVNYATAGNNVDAMYSGTVGGEGVSGSFVYAAEKPNVVHDIEEILAEM